MIEIIRNFLTPEILTGVMLGRVFSGIIIGYPLALVIGTIGLGTAILLWGLDMIQPHG